MFGYIRPYKEELQESDWNLYRAYYCGMCHALRKRAGLLASFTVSFDITFLALLFAPLCCQTEMKRCIRHPLKKRNCVCIDRNLEQVADLSIMLTWWKLKDTVHDDSGIKKVAANILCVLFKSCYERCKREYPQMEETISGNIYRLEELENNNCDSLDKVADCFANILASAVLLRPESDERLAYKELLYHLGRTVYLLDAVDDFAKDRECGNYNPLLYRCGDSITESDRSSLQKTLNLSQRQMSYALDFIDDNGNISLLKNIIEQGIPHISYLIVNDYWKNRKILMKEITQ